MMRLRSLQTVFAPLLFVGIVASESSTQPAKAPAGLQDFRKLFAAAVAEKDRPAVANLSRFPLGIEGYGLGPKLSEHDFLHDKNHFDGIFFAGDAEVVKCLRTAALAYQP